MGQAYILEDETGQRHVVTEADYRLARATVGVYHIAADNDVTIYKVLK